MTSALVVMLNMAKFSQKVAKGGHTGYGYHNVSMSDGVDLGDELLGIDTHEVRSHSCK